MLLPNFNLVTYVYVGALDLDLEGAAVPDIDPDIEADENPYAYASGAPTSPNLNFSNASGGDTREPTLHNCNNANTCHETKFCDYVYHAFIYQPRDLQVKRRAVSTSTKRPLFLAES